MIDLWNKIKVGVITGIIVLMVTLLCNWIIDSAKQAKSERTIHILTDSVYTFKKQLNDSVSVMVTERRQYSQTLAMARRENKAFKSPVTNDINKRRIVSTEQTNAKYTDSVTIKLYEDSLGIYRGSYEDLYRTMEAYFNPENNTLTIPNDTIIVPINVVGYLAKIDYKNYTGIKRIWKRIFEKKKLMNRTWSENPKVKIESSKFINIEK